MESGKTHHKFFHAIISLEDVDKKKPDPEPYLLVARRFRLSPAECIAIEDSVAGILSAKAPVVMRSLLFHITTDIKISVWRIKSFIS